MANIAITRRCNRRCAYCFAMPGSDTAATRAMSLERFEQTLDWLQGSGIGEARLLGGEPTIHPEFQQFVERVVARGMKLRLFSGGMIPKRALETLRTLDGKQLDVLVNVCAPNMEYAAIERRQRAVFAALGHRVTLGLNIESPGTRLDFLLDLITEYGLARAVRLGLAHPTTSGGNTFLHPRHYRKVGARTTDFALRARALGVDVEFDCGWVPCMFPGGALEALGKTARDVGLRCSPILDVLPGGDVISCFALGDDLVLELDEGLPASNMRARFEQHYQVGRAFWLYKDCHRCQWRKLGACRGGCLSASMRRLRHYPFQIDRPDATVLGPGQRKRP